MAQPALDKGWDAERSEPPSRSQSVLDIDRAIKFRTQVRERRPAMLDRVPVLLLSTLLPSKSLSKSAALTPRLVAVTGIVAA